MRKGTTKHLFDLKLPALLTLLALSNLGAEGGFPAKTSAECDKCIEKALNMAFSPVYLRVRETETVSVGASVGAEANWTVGSSPGKDVVKEGSVDFSPNPAPSTTISLVGAEVFLRKISTAMDVVAQSSDPEVGTNSRWYSIEGVPPRIEAGSFSLGFPRGFEGVKEVRMENVAPSSSWVFDVHIFQDYVQAEVSNLTDQTALVTLRLSQNPTFSSTTISFDRAGRRYCSGSVQILVTAKRDQRKNVLEFLNVYYNVLDGHIGCKVPPPATIGGGAF